MADVMGKTETERKFLVKDDSYKKMATAHIRMRQGYICRESGRTVRVRIAGDRAWLTIKGASTDDGLSRYEWEKEIPADEAAELMKLCHGTPSATDNAPLPSAGTGHGTAAMPGTGKNGPFPEIIDKTRHIVPFGGHVFEVDEFHGANDGLTVAEIELENAAEPFSRPEWLGEEVTGDRRYYNSMLIAAPYSSWDR